MILGGKDKGADWSELVSLIPSHARRVLLVGEFARELQRLLQGTVPVELCGTIPRAVDSARQGAEAGDVVLLSPGCASFDQYSHFEERGEDFKRVVRALAAPGGSDG